MTVYCLFLLESPHRGNSNEYTQYTIFNLKKENHPKSSPICMWNLIEIGPVFSEEKSFKNVDRQITSEIWPNHQMTLTSRIS